MRPANIRSSFVLALFGCSVLFGGRFAIAADERTSELVKMVSKPTSSKAAHQDAIDALPLDLMTPEHRERAEQLIDSVDVYREMATLSFEVSPEVYAYFLSNPEMAVSIWRAMEISQFEMSQNEDGTYVADAKDGSEGVITVLCRSTEHHVIACDGLFKSPLLAKPIKAKALFHLQTTYSREADGRTLAKHRGHLWVSFPSLTVGAAAKVMSPLSNRIIDHNFYEVSVFMHMFSMAMSRQPGWVEQLANRLDGIQDSRKADLLALTAKVYVDARKRELEKTNGPGGVTLQDVMQPLRTATYTEEDGTQAVVEADGNATEE